MKTSRFLTVTSYPDVSEGILSSSHLSFLPVVKKCRTVMPDGAVLFRVHYVLFVQILLRDLSSSVPHSTPSAYLASTSLASWWRYRQTASFLPAAVAPTDSGSPVTFLQTNVACSFQIGLLSRSVSLRSSCSFPSSVYTTNTAVPKLTSGG
jgi:hypothetical protein